MAWPQTALPVFVEIAPGAAAAGDPSGAVFADVTGDVLQVADQIDIGTGRGDWGKEADAGTCSATFLNSSGDYSEFNPNGQWYGQLGKDTPMRVGLRRVADAFADRTVAAGWGTSPDGEPWSYFDAGGPLNLSDASVSAGLARHSVPVANAYRSNWLAGVSLADVRVRLEGIRLPFSDVTGGSVEPGGISLRMQDIATMYLCRIEVTTAEAVVLHLYNPAGAELAFATVAGLTHSAAQALDAIAEITGDTIRMKVWASGGDEPGDWHVSATDSTLLDPGGVGIRTGVAPGNSNAMPIVATYDSVTVYADLFGGWVPAWVPRSDISGKIRTVPVGAKGALYRIQPATGKSPDVSPFRRHIMSTPGLLAYWPCEDLPGSIQIASAIPGAPPMAVSDADDVTFAGDPAEAGGSGFAQRGSAIGYTNLIQPGTKALANLAAGGRLRGLVPRVGTSSPVEWSVCFLARTNSLQAGKEILLAEWEAPGGTYKIFRLYQTVGGTIALFGIDAAEVGWSLLSWSDATFSLTEYRVEAGTIGGSAQINLWVDGDLKDSAVFGSTTLTRVTTVTANPNATSVTGVTGWWVGQIQVWDTSTPPPLGANLLNLAVADTDAYGEPFFPFFRHLNETAHDRLGRLFGQDNVPVFIPPVDADKTTRMGPQPDGPPSDLYRECERTDGGVLYERPFALGYQPRAALYAQPAALELTAADLASAPAPDGSRQRYRNRWQVTRTDGSSGVAESDDVEAGAIVADESEEINTATEAVLTDQASWRLHLANSKDLRWPVLEFDLWTSPELLDAVLNLRPGSRITVADPPADVAGEEIDVIFEGWTVTLGYKSFAVAASCSPAKPWRVATVAAGARAGSRTAAVAKAATAGATDLLVADPSGPWTTTAQFPADFPFDANASGERVTVSAIGPALADSYARTVANGWGNADTGQPYAVAGTAADYAVAAGVATQSNTAVNTLHAAVVDVGSSDVDFMWDCRLAIGTALGAEARHWIAGRYLDVNNYYVAILALNTAGAVTLRLGLRLAGVLSFISGGTTVGVNHVGGDTWRTRLQVFGSTVRTRAWLTGAAEPGDWQQTAPATDLTAGTSIAALSRLETGNGNTLPVTFTFDNLTVIAPQKWTVARNVNNLPGGKAQTPGAPVRLWTPYVVGM